MVSNCVAYTFDHFGPKCILHSRTEKGIESAPRKQIGLKKHDFILSLPEMDFCSEKRRKRRCRWEANCDHVNCLRKAFNHFTLFKLSWKLCYRVCDQVLSSKRKLGYDTDFIKDEYGCITNECECAPFDQNVIGK